MQWVGPSLPRVMVPRGRHTGLTADFMLANEAMEFMLRKVGRTQPCALHVAYSPHSGCMPL